MAGSSTPDLVAMRSRQQQAWAAGDYAMVGTMTVIVSEVLCEDVDLRSGQRVLDIATGSGNTAIAAARRFCSVTGVDYVPALIERARERAAAERLAIDFQVTAAEDLPFPDATFDVVLSTFGIMFAPDQERAAQEMLRVCRPGGTIGLANWSPAGYGGEFFRLGAKYFPPPAGLKPALSWGTEERLRELIGDGVSSLELRPQTYMFHFLSADHWLDYYRTHFGPVVRAFEALDADAQQAYRQELLGLFGRYNRASDGTIAAEAEYVEVIAKRA